MSATSFQLDLAAYGPRATPQARPSSEEARRYCRELATRHYENFTVASWLLPRQLRQHFCNVYAYCRWADDLADEVESAEQSLRLLDWWEEQLQACYAGDATHPVFVALTETIREFQIPIDPFRDLLTAFRLDQTKTRYETFDELLEYCRYSANPVGHLVLYLGRSYEPHTAQLSDSICTGLQLANHWQDVARDYRNGRVYLPREDRQRFRVDDAHLAASSASLEFSYLLQFEVDRAARYFEAGPPLIEQVRRELQLPINLFVRGGLATIDAIRQQNYDVLAKRPRVGRAKKLQLLMHALRAPRKYSPGELPSDLLTNSYRHCREKVRESGSNFAWAFWLLTREKRYAMNALYAFARITDDMGDDEELGDAEQRQALLAAWRQGFDAVHVPDSDYSDDCPCPAYLPAIEDAVIRFRIPRQLLHDLIDGVQRDLQSNRMADWAELQQYCYQVAGTVGLACIYIWGFQDDRALDLAKTCGEAFQLTNILRDLQEDAARDRIYLPLDELARFQYSPDDLRQSVADERFDRLMDFQLSRAEALYDEAAQLVNYLSPDGRRVFRLMFARYRAILAKIRQDPRAVFTQRISLSLPHKLAIAARELWRRD